MTLGFVLTFATALPAYQAVVYGLLTGGPDQIASAFLGAKSGATLAFVSRLDGLFGAVLEIGRTLAALRSTPASKAESTASCPYSRQLHPPALQR